MPDEKLLWKESNYETRFVNACAKRGWICEKFTVPGKRGVPDRLVTAGHGYICFVELKQPGKKPEPLQVLDHEKRRKLGADVYVASCMKSVNYVIEKIEQEVQFNENCGR